MEVFGGSASGSVVSDIGLAVIRGRPASDGSSVECGMRIPTTLRKRKQPFALLQAAVFRVVPPQGYKEGGVSAIFFALAGACRAASTRKYEHLFVFFNHEKYKTGQICDKIVQYKREPYLPGRLLQGRTFFNTSVFSFVVPELTHGNQPN